MADHSLEISWWIENPPPTQTLPPSSIMSFTKLGNGERRTEDDIHQECLIQIGSDKLHLHAKWLPLMMTVQLTQAAALQASINAFAQQKHNTSREMLRLMWFHNFLLQQFAQDATHEAKELGRGPLPESWMPASMHRYLTRVEQHISHSADNLEDKPEQLNKAYHEAGDHFTHGEINLFLTPTWRLLFINIHH